MTKLTIYLESDNFSNSSEAHNIHAKSRLGEKEQGKIIYSDYETMFLFEEKGAEILKKIKRLSRNELISLFSKRDKRFNEKYIVFRDLRKKGYIVKTGLKFGADFRIYDKKEKEGHAKWIVFVDKESNKFNWHEFCAKNRVAHSTRKKLLLAIVDGEKKITYFEIGWIKIN